MSLNKTVSLRVFFYILGSLCLAVPVQSQNKHTGLDQIDTAELTLHGGKLSKQQVRTLENQLLQQPDDMKARIQLLGYYFLHRPHTDVRAKHIFWIIQHHPEAEIAGQPEAGMMPGLDVQYGKAKSLWLTQVDAHPQNTAVLGNAASFLLINDGTTAEKLLKQAQSVEPEKPQWPARLGQVYALKVGSLAETERKGTAQQALRYYEQAYALDKTYTGEGGGGLEDLAKMAYEASDYAKAQDYAARLLESATSKDGQWDYGNAIHHSNLIMGRLALHAGDVEKAKIYLLAAGKTPGSPQLDSFGPNMMLAKELLEKGEKQVVLDYFALCSKFWKEPQLQQWTAEVQKGETPDFGGNLIY